RERRQHRHDLFLEIGVEPAALGRRPAVPRQEADSLALERGQQRLVQQLVLAADERQRAGAYLVEKLARRQAIRPRGRGVDLQPLLEGGDADLEELVEVRRRDTEEAQP